MKEIDDITILKQILKYGIDDCDARAVPISMAIDSVINSILNQEERIKKIEQNTIKE